MKGKIDRIEADITIIHLDNNDILNFPKNQIPTSIKQGDKIKLKISLENEKKILQTEDDVKQILNDILQN